MKYIGLHCHKKYDYATMIDTEPGDTSAQVDLPTKTDSWNLVILCLFNYSAYVTQFLLS